ncbi:MerR family transcriptional regulator [Enterococcus hermanniensis]|uniref:Transcriptional regulator, MerR family n=1 Tax=Enterococcus hermanniensis TaxID=249189 RepID=A0A1L8TJG7_9ENTE|nr:MerR family transcriptional regulator [Enterococcus hermanniensis]OJG44343.1 transcriptional regulator, MerR family [Enterococcus hermanniensis]
MKISDLAKKTQLPISTIRFYERRGLLSSDYFTRDKNGYRNYDSSAVQQLKFISLLLSNGFSITELLKINEKFGDSRTIEENIQLLEGKLMETKAKQKELAETEKILNQMLSNKKQQLHK